MTKEGYIKYWITTSKHDWKRVEELLKLRDFSFALFCAHLSIEKLAKALWVKEHESNFPPRIHNLITLFSKTSFKALRKPIDVDERTKFFSNGSPLPGACPKNT
jgi:HEPN domain-containing protein